jgi:hypothetical protein
VVRDPGSDRPVQIRNRPHRFRYVTRPGATERSAFGLLDATITGKRLAVAKGTMGVVFLLLFFVLLMSHPRYAFVSMAIAIVLLYRGKVKSATTKARRRVDEEVYSSDI